MENQMLTGVLGLVVIAFLIVLALLWFLLPFAVFGLKDRLADIKREIAASNATLEMIARHAAVIETSAKRAEAKAIAPTVAADEPVARDYHGPRT